MDITPKNIQDLPESGLDSKEKSPDRMQYENEKDRKHTAESRRPRTTIKDAKESSESTQDNKDKFNRRRKNKKQVNKKPIECEFCGRGIYVCK